MKLVGIAGTTEEVSYNKMLLQYIANQFSDLVDVEILSIDDLPMFDQDNDQTNSGAIQYLNRKIKAADGVIIATPEHNHTTTPALKSLIEWLSYKIHPLTDKPILLVGASYYDQGSSRAQLNLRQILESPGVNAVVMPSNEFLLANVKTAFDENGNLKDAGTVKFLGSTLQKFHSFVKVINTMNVVAKEDAAQQEDLTASGKISTTIEGVEMTDEHWVEKAAEKVHAVSGNTYVKLDRGILTVDQLNYFLNSMPMELTYADSNNQFIYYNNMAPTEEMLAPRRPGQAGDPLESVHPKRAVKHVKQVIHALRTGKTPMVQMPVPGNTADKYVMHYYKAMHDENGDYAGINELVLDIMPIVKKFLQRTGQKLVADPDAKADTGAGASQKAPVADADAGASEKAAPADTEASASVDEPAPEAPAKPAATDTESSASIND
ncbi:NAD(P)H-dependent oxidoreductase [Loigolactobacillus bifermentans]|uniref:NADPH-dependent FMN reductase domain protein n=1 Tax=Loigolactobacillus bifermentans DSM 20003 TaxID=1423726 RepID=A0A0R1GXJ7_9LACO|nr:NAD(P)H-dependent oxidoreductase [Loigolactobacillus bifermentans]KRK39068.1 NADPH-dependent FMN reductase domain protein [Loigolactobacillus bifermentans DSM 20003]QGG59044.1 NADPH-dependent oxidoreductase [Loigolactobacillus bifermentans]